MGMVKRLIEAAGEVLYPGNNEEAWNQQDAFMKAIVNGQLNVDAADLQNIINGDEATIMLVKDQMARQK